MAGLARGKIIYGDSSGDPAALALGTANQVLTSDGTDVAWADNVNTYVSGVAAYASGQAIDNETDLVYVSGAAAYASGNTIVNDGLIAYASGNTANIAFGSNAEGDILYHDGSTFTTSVLGFRDCLYSINALIMY